MGSSCSWVCLLLTFIIPVTATAEAGVIERLLLAAQQRPWLWGIYVFTVGLPIILFISLMWPDKRFGPADQQYYYKKSDDIQADDLPASDQRDTRLRQHRRADRDVARRRETGSQQKKSDL